MTTGTDPVRGMTVGVQRETAQSTFEGKTHHLCSADRRDAWDADPHRYADKEAATQSSGWEGEVIDRFPCGVSLDGETGAIHVYPTYNRRSGLRMGCLVANL